MNNYLKQIWFELRNQPVVTITSALGTAFAIFFVMAVYMVASVETVAIKPESNRDRILIGQYMELNMGDDVTNSGSMSYNNAKKIYSGLEGIELISFSGGWDKPSDVSVKDGDCITMTQKRVDGNFWKIFDFKFIGGKPFDKTASESGLKQVILQKASAKKLFGNEDAVGKEIKLDHIPYTVVGVVDDTSPILAQSYANIYVPYTPEKEDELWGNGYMGDTQVYLLMSDGVSDEDIRKQVRQRYDIFNSTLKKDGIKAIFHQAPFTAEMAANNLGSNNDPDAESPRKQRYAIYLVLLLLPAINLSSMTRSRLRQRVSEIGVRRAFGATKLNILNRFFGENFALTLCGGVIGLVLCMIFIALFSNYFISYGGLWAEGDITSAKPTFNMLLNFKTFGLALLFCLILNILSTGLPAWRASRTNPAEAISGKND